MRLVKGISSTLAVVVLVAVVGQFGLLGSDIGSNEMFEPFCWF